MSVTDPTAQRLAALEAANAIRSARSELKRWLKADATLELAVRILDEPASVELELGAPATSSWPVLGYLQSVRGLGRVKAAKVLRKGNIAAARKLGDLTERERTYLITTITTIATNRRPS